MEVFTKIIINIMKSVIGNKIENEFKKELFDNSYEDLSEKITQEFNNFIKKENSKIKYILSKENLNANNIPEDRHSFIVTEIEELLCKIEITNDQLAKCKYDNKNLSSYFWYEYLKAKNYHIEYEKEIKHCLYLVAIEINKLIQESEKFQTELLISINNSIADTNLKLHNISDFLKVNFEKLDKNTQTQFNTLQSKLEHLQDSNSIINEQEKLFQNDKKIDYIKNWNSRLFLHMYNEKRPITLADAFIMPAYEILRSIQRLNFSDTVTFDKIVETFIEYNTNSTMLITGVPGIGKTSITSWIANKYKNDPRLIILRFRDWDPKEIKKGFFNAICTTLKCRKMDLDNLIIVLDGYDEMKTLNLRHQLLKDFFNEIKDFKNFKCIITSRPAYINSYNFQNVIKLKEFDIHRVETFVEIITQNKLEHKDQLKDNLEVLGIPVILYMAIMSNTDISKNPTKAELYNRIFAENGGIFDKFYDGEIQYDEGMQIIRDPENTKIYLDFLKQTAFLMFKKNTLVVNKNEIEIPKLIFQRKSISILEFPIKHLFEKVEANIEFIHKSIYEYFVAEYIFTFMYKGAKENTEYLASILGELFQSVVLEKEFLEFLKYKISLYNYFQDLKTAFELMLKNGLTYYTNKCYKDIPIREACILTNMFKIFQLYENKNFKLDISKSYYFKQNISGLNLYKIILTNQMLQGCCLINANLKEANLENVNLSRANLENSDLTKSNLNGVNFEGANLSGVKLTHTTLKRVSFNNVNLTNADLSKMEFIGGDLSTAYLQNANLAGANLQNACLIGLDLSKTLLNRTILTSANLTEANLAKTNLKGAILKKAILRDAYLRSANLTEANLTGCILDRAYLKGAHFKNTVLVGIELKNVNLNEVCLYGAILDEQQISYLTGFHSLEGTKVYLNNTEKIVTYEEYITFR